MKKTLLGVVVIGVVFVLSGCGKQAATDQSTEGSKIKTEVQTQKQDSSSVISSIKDAMNLGKKMKCEYTMKVEGSEPIKSTAFIEGKKFKSVGAFNGIVSNTIFDGEVMYLWQEGQKNGMKMTMTCINSLKESLPQDKKDGSEATSPEDQFKDATETSCSPTTENIDFSAPATVTFADQCEMLKGLTESMKNVNIPGNASVPIAR